jgi:hypothetical protein
MGMFAGEYQYLKEKGTDNKGNFKIIETEVIKEDNCNCHPETCACRDYSYRYYEKVYEDGTKVQVEKNGTEYTEI